MSAVLDKPTVAAPPHHVRSAPANTFEPRWVRWTLIAVALAFLTLFLFVPLVAVFTEALKRGWDTYVEAILDPDAISAIKLTLIAAGIGVPGLALYFAARALGLNTNVQPANLVANWWTVPVLIGLAIMNGVLEEVVIVGYWFTRMSQAGWSVAAVLIGSAVIRGSYHLYQGFGGFVGNLAMGLVFGWIYLRTKRIGPLVAAHIILDLFAFVGYSLLAPYVDWL